MVKVLNVIPINDKTLRKIKVDGEVQYILANQFYDEINLTVDEAKKYAYEILQDCLREGI